MVFPKKSNPIKRAFLGYKSKRPGTSSCGTKHYDVLHPTPETRTSLDESDSERAFSTTAAIALVAAAAPMHYQRVGDGDPSPARAQHFQPPLSEDAHHKQASSSFSSKRAAQEQHESTLPSNKHTNNNNIRGITIQQETAVICEIFDERFKKDSNSNHNKISEPPRPLHPSRPQQQQQGGRRSPAVSSAAPTAAGTRPSYSPSLFYPVEQAAAVEEDFDQFANDFTQRQETVVLQPQTIQVNNNHSRGTGLGAKQNYEYGRASPRNSSLDDYSPLVGRMLNMDPPDNNSASSRGLDSPGLTPDQRISRDPNGTAGFLYNNNNNNQRQLSYRKLDPSGRCSPSVERINVNTTSSSRPYSPGPTLKVEHAVPVLRRDFQPAARGRTSSPFQYQRVPSPNHNNNTTNTSSSSRRDNNPRLMGRLSPIVTSLGDAVQNRRHSLQHETSNSWRETKAPEPSFSVAPPTTTTTTTRLSSSLNISPTKRKDVVSGAFTTQQEPQGWPTTTSLLVGGRVTTRDGDTSKQQQQQHEPTTEDVSTATSTGDEEPSRVRSLVQQWNRRLTLTSSGPLDAMMMSSRPGSTRSLVVAASESPVMRNTRASTTTTTTRGRCFSEDVVETTTRRSTIATTTQEEVGHRSVQAPPATFDVDNWSRRDPPSPFFLEKDHEQNDDMVRRNNDRDAGMRPPSPFFSDEGYNIQVIDLIAEEMVTKATPKNTNNNHNTSLANEGNRGRAHRRHSSESLEGQASSQARDRAPDHPGAKGSTLEFGTKENDGQKLVVSSDEEESSETHSSASDFLVAKPARETRAQLNDQRRPAGRQPLLEVHRVLNTDDPNKWTYWVTDADGLNEHLEIFVVNFEPQLGVDEHPPSMKDDDDMVPENRLQLFSRMWSEVSLGGNSMKRAGSSSITPRLRRRSSSRRRTLKPSLSFRAGPNKSRMRRSFSFNGG